ncbi:hypothetical protein KBC89_00990 [Candidatus Woesebacteria bacterium]|nr:hypothetical protein [Candidatus Woesebacteria bacterium]
MMQSAEFDVVKDFESQLHSLRDQVSLACDQAMPFNNFDDFLESFLNPPEIEIDENKVPWIILEWENRPCSVYVDQSHLYPTLLLLGCRQMIKAHWDLTDEELDSEEYQQEYADYYRDNINKHTSHEFQHYLGALQHTSLQCRFGITFFQTPENGAQFIPSVSFRGKVMADIFLEKVAKNPDSLSQGDRLYLLKTQQTIAEITSSE